MKQAYIKTPLGSCLIEGDENGITKIWVLNEDMPVSKKVPLELQAAVIQLEEYFTGSRKNFDFKLNPTGTDFQKKVWQALLEIPFGKTMSYHQLAVKLGDVKAIRAVASANGKNPLWVVVPCHRVIGADGFPYRICRRAMA
jgi:methylated-DNA-[protein]-cysteine S-methyltransferase